MQKLSEWMGHKVYSNGNTVIKTPKTGLWGTEDITHVAQLLQYAKERFEGCMVDTVIEDDGAGSYRLQQPFIDWQHINTENIDSVRDKFQSLLQAHIDSIQDNGYGLDFVWLEWSIKWTFAQYSQYRWTGVDRMFITPALQIASKGNGMFSGMLGFWERWALPELSNLMIDSMWDIKIVDTTLTELKSKSFIKRGRSYILERWNRRFLKKHFKIIY